MGVWWRTIRLLRFLLNHSLSSQSTTTLPTITTCPYRPTLKSNEVPPQVWWWPILMVLSLLSLSDVFPIDMFTIMLVHFWPLAFLLFPLILIFWHSLYQSMDYLSMVWQVLSLSISWFVNATWPSFNAPYLDLFRSAWPTFDDLFLDTS